MARNRSGAGRGGAPWSRTLNLAQRKTVTKIRREHEVAGRDKATHGWSILMVPSVGPAKDVTLIHRHTVGSASKWKIFPDGSYYELDQKGNNVYD